MLLITLLSITLIGSLLYCIVHDDCPESAMLCILGVVGSFFITAGFGVYFATNKHWPDTFEIVKTVKSPIVSLTNNNSLNGQFFLGCGMINSEERYVFMRVLGSDSYMRDSVSTSGTIIKESKDEPPSYTYDVVVRHNDRRWKRICPDAFRDEGDKGNANFRIVVPPHTIIQRFEVK